MCRLSGNANGVLPTQEILCDRLALIFVVDFHRMRFSLFP